MKPDYLVVCCAVALVLCGAPVAAAAGSDAAAESAELAARHMAAVSAALAQFQNEVNATAQARARHIVAVRRLAYDGRQKSDREVDILKQTDGQDLARVFDALREHGDRAAMASSKADAAEAAARAEISAAYTPLEISTQKLDKAATTLAGLGKPQSGAERALFLAKFIKDTRDETRKLLEDGKKAGDAANKKLADTASAAQASLAAAQSD